MRRKMTKSELRDLHKSVINECTFIKRQNNRYDAMDILKECKTMINQATIDFIVSVPVELYLIRKVENAFLSTLK